MTLGLTHVSNTVYFDQAYMVDRVLNPLHQHLNPFAAIHIVTSLSYTTVLYIGFQILHSGTGRHRYSTSSAEILLS